MSTQKGKSSESHDSTSTDKARTGSPPSSAQRSPIDSLRDYKPNRKVPELSQEELKKIWLLLEMDDEPSQNTSAAEWLFEIPPPLEEYGQLAELPEIQVLHWLSLFKAHCCSAPKKFKIKFFDLLADKYLQNDADFFKRLSTLIGMVQNEIPLVNVKLRDLGIKQKPGRKTQPHDLSNAVPIAVNQLLSYRVWEIPPDSLTRRTHRITREELKKEIRRIQIGLGDTDAVEISDKELSRQISNSPVREFME